MTEVTIPEFRRLAAATMSEAELQQHVLDLAAQLGYIAYHPRPGRTAHGWRTPLTGTPGFPDLVLAREARPGMPDRLPRLVFVELKSARGQVGRWQEVWLATLRDACTDTRVELWRPRDLVEGRVLEVLR